MRPCPSNSLMVAYQPLVLLPFFILATVGPTMVVPQCKAEDSAYRPTVCKAKEEKICLYYNPITKQLKQNPKLNTLMQPMNEHASNHVKEFHQKDHHHRLDKYVAYKMSVMALRRLEESEKVLALKHHFPRLVNEINNCTYEIEHVGFQSDQIDVQLNEETIRTQVHHMRQIMEHAGVMHMDYEPHCKNIVYQEKTGKISLIDWDIIALRSNVTISGAKPMWMDSDWYPDIYADRFLDMRGWDNFEKRMLAAMKACLSPTCFCRDASK